MTKIELCEKILACTYRIVVLWKNELISDGTAVCYHPTGRLLTAWHVIDAKMRLMDSGYLNDPDLQLYAIPANGEGNYRVLPGMVGYELDVGRGMQKPFRVDLAVVALAGVIEPKPFLALSDTIFPVGTEVLMCGFPDEMEYPFRMDENIDWAGVQGGPRTQTEMDIFKNLSLMRSGMIGHVSRLKMGVGRMEIDGTAYKSQFEGAEYWIDNVSNLGASGGPVVTMDGYLIGTVTRRGATSIRDDDARNLRRRKQKTRSKKRRAANQSADEPEIQIPSGSTIAISTGFITWMRTLIQ
jgi:hypothetical protein